MEYREEDLVRIAKRDNNKKRTYLIVDPLQGKHMPVSPTKALQLFFDLTETFQEEYRNEKLLLIGFAETATAIGAAAAIKLDADYIQTTREEVPDAEYLYFSEEHSHASEQKLVKNDLDEALKKADRVLFIEDEITTGKTILNIISKIEKVYPKKVKFSAASILNGMTEEHLENYKERKIKLHSLVKTDHSKYENAAEQMEENGNYYVCKDEKEEADQKVLTIWNAEGYQNTRRLVSASVYEEACENLWKQIKEKIENKQGKKILVLGTEEFMYPALFVGKKFEEMGNEVCCHATTRSPIAVSQSEDYPLYSRYELKSLYEAERKTFLYNIQSYDEVFLITDALRPEQEGLYSIANALWKYNDKITLIRWC